MVGITLRLLMRMRWLRRLFYRLCFSHHKDPQHREALRMLVESLATTPIFKKKRKPSEPFEVDLDTIDPAAPKQTALLPYGVLQWDAQGAHLVRNDGIETFLSRDGQSQVIAPGNSRIEIEDASSVINHSVNRVYNTTSHVIKFINGGALSFMEDDAHGPIEIHYHRVNIGFPAPGVLRVRVSEPSEPKEAAQ